MIDNGKAGSQNAATSAVERIHTTSNQASLSIALHCRRLLASPLESLQELHQCTDDMRRAFRQLPIQNTGSDFASSRFGCRQLRRGSFVNCGACHSASRAPYLTLTESAAPLWPSVVDGSGYQPWASATISSTASSSVCPMSLPRVPIPPPMVGLRA